MFRGGDYIDRTGFADITNKPGHNYMSTHDIPGAKPKKIFSRGRMAEAGNAIMGDNNVMSAAGV